MILKSNGIVTLVVFVIICYVSCDANKVKMTNALFKILSKVPELSTDIPLSESLQSYFTINHGATTTNQTVFITKQIGDKIEEILLPFKDTYKITNTILAQFPLSESVGESVNKIMTQMEQIAGYADQLIEYSHHTDLLNGSEYKIFTEKLADVQKTQEGIKLAFIGKSVNDTGKMQDIHYLLLTKEYYYCGKIAAAEQELYLKLYEMIVITEIRGYALSRYLSYINGIPLTVDGLLARLMAYETYFEMHLANKKTSYTRCLPTVHEEDKTFIRMTRLIEGYVQNEQYLNSDGSCYKDCDQPDTKDHNCEESDDECKGRIISCLADKEYDSVRICNSQGKQLNTQRYQILQLDGISINTKTCHQEVKVLEYWSPPKAFTKCKFCFCFYSDEDNENSDRFVSLLESSTDLASHRVVTGLKFIKKEHMIYLQIQEGALLKGGNVNTETVRWKKVQEIDPWHKKRTNGIHFYAFSVLDGHTAVDLDNIIADKGYAVTGVRFGVRKDSKDKQYLKLEARMTKLDTINGLIIKETSKWVSSSEESHNHRHLGGDEVPTNRFKETEKHHWKGGEYIQFGHSSIRNDAAQSTIPFFDAQNVSMFSPTPLEGVGIIYKSQGNSGGFIVPQIFGYNFSGLVSNEINMGSNVERPHVLGYIGIFIMAIMYVLC